MCGHRARIGVFSKGAALICAFGIHFQVSGESLTTNIIDGFATNIAGTFTLGDTGPYNLLLITNNGVLTDDQGYIGNTVDAHSNVGIVAGIGSVWSNNQALYVGRVSPSNVVNILAGGTLFVGNALGIGSAATANDNFLSIAGPDSLLVTPFFYLGTYGSGNQLVVEDGARARLGALTLNSEQSTNGGRNSALFRNAGTFVTLTGSLQLGGAPANQLLITDGARLETSQATVGSHLYSPSNRVELSRSGTFWVNSNTLVFGASGSSNNAILILTGATLQTKNITAGTSGNLITVDGGNLVTGTLQLGQDANTFGNRLEVLNPGGHLSQTQTFNIGNFGSRNSFTLSNGARADSGATTIGAQSSSNSALATGAGTLWVSDGLEVGSAGNSNQLTISNGARVYTGRLVHGATRGRGNITRVTGLNSLLSVTNAIDLGWRNMLEVGGLARIESDSGIIGNFGYDSNVVLLSGGSWSNAAGLTIGSGGNANFLAVSNASRLDCTDVAIGLETQARRNRAEISGAKTLWNVRSNLSVGVLGDSNVLAISQGAAVFARNVFVAAHDLIQEPPPTAVFSSDHNALTVDGTNTALNAMANLFIGNNGRSNQFVVSGSAQVNVTNDVFVGYRGRSNRLELRSGARFNSSSLAIGWHSNSAHNAVLVDSGSRMATTGLTLGAEGYGGSLIISNGAVLQSRDVTIGSNGIALGPVGGCSNQFGFNQVVVTGTGSVWRSSGRMTIGYNSTSNSITVRSGGAFHVNDISISSGPLCDPALLENRLTVEGGTFIVSNRVYITRGRFRMLSGQSTIASVFVEGGLPGRCEILGGTLRCPSLYASGPAEIRIGDGVHRAVWQIDGGSSFSSGAITIASNSVVAGRGSISGAITNFGIFGTLSAVSDITNTSPTLQSSSGLDVWIQQLGPGTGHTVLRLSWFPFAPPMLNGRLRVALSRAWQPLATDEFPVVMFPSATGGFLNAPDNSRIKTIDNLASFLVLYRSNAVVLTDYRSTDLDGDGIEDAWANTYFGHSPLSSAEKLADSDGDGASNLSEFIAGTDPTDAGSVLRVRASFGGRAPTLEWPCIDGKSYRVFFSSDMRIWREVRDPTFAFPQPAVCRWTDDGQSTGNPGAGMRFYRVAVE